MGGIFADLAVLYRVSEERLVILLKCWFFVLLLGQPVDAEEFDRGGLDVGRSTDLYRLKWTIREKDGNVGEYFIINGFTVRETEDAV